MLRTVMENAGLAIWPQMALVIFVGVFVAVLFNEVRRPRQEAEKLSRMPMDDEN